MSDVTTVYLGDGPVAVTVVWSRLIRDADDPTMFHQTDEALAVAAGSVTAVMTHTPSGTTVPIDPATIQFDQPWTQHFLFDFTPPSGVTTSSPDGWRADWTAREDTDDPATADTVTASELFSVEYPVLATWISVAEIAQFEGVTVSRQDLLKAQRDINRKVPAWTPDQRTNLLALGAYGSMIVEGCRDAVMAQALWLKLRREEAAAGKGSRFRRQLQVAREENVQNFSQGGNSTTFAAAPDGRPADLGQRAWDAIRPLLELGDSREGISVDKVLTTGALFPARTYYDDPIWTHRTAPADAWIW